MKGIFNNIINVWVIHDVLFFLFYYCSLHRCKCFLLTVQLWYDSREQVRCTSNWRHYTNFELMKSQTSNQICLDFLKLVVNTFLDWAKPFVQDNLPKSTKIPGDLTTLDVGQSTNLNRLMQCWHLTFYQIVWQILRTCNMIHLNFNMIQ